MTIFHWQRPLEGTHMITFGLFTSTSHLSYLQILCHTSVKNWVSFPLLLLSVQSWINWHVSGCGVHFHGYVLICVKGGLKQTYDLVNFEEIFFQESKKMCECQCCRGQCNHVPYCDSTDMLCDSTDHYSLWVQNCKYCCLYLGSSRIINSPLLVCFFGAPETLDKTATTITLLWK